MGLRSLVVLSLFALFLSLLEVAEAGFRQGFKKDAEPLSKQEIRRTAERLMLEEPYYDSQASSLDEPHYDSRDGGPVHDPYGKGSKKGSKSSKSSGKGKGGSKSSGKGGKGKGKGGGSGSRDYRSDRDSRSAPAGNRDEYGNTLDFVIIMQETAYSPQPDGTDVPIGTRFAFSGELSTADDEMGRASGSCTVASEQDADLTVCDIFLKFYFADGDGTLAMTGHTDAIDGHFQVTGSGGILKNTNSGAGRVYFDPAGNPILYVLLKME